MNLGIIGAGYMAQKYLEVLDCNPKINITCLCSRTSKSSKTLASRFGIKKFYTNLKKMLNENKMDALIIAVSAENTYQICKYILNNKIPVLIEKPVSLSFLEATKLASIAKKNGVKNMVALNRRYYSNFRKIKSIIAKDQVKNIIIEGHERFWRVSGNYSKIIEKNWLFANSIHTLDLLLFFGGNVKKVNILKKKQKNKYADNYQLSINFKNDAIGSYISNFDVPGGWSLKVYTKNHFFNCVNLEHCIYNDRLFNKKKINFDKFDKKYKPGLYWMLEAFYQYIRNNKKEQGIQTIQDNLKIMKIINSIYEKKYN